MPSTPWRRERSCYITRRSSWRMVTNGNPSWLPLPGPMHHIDKVSRGPMADHHPGHPSTDQKKMHRGPRMIVGKLPSLHLSPICDHVAPFPPKGFIRGQIVTMMVKRKNNGMLCDRRTLRCILRSWLGSEGALESRPLLDLDALLSLVTLLVPTFSDVLLALLLPHLLGLVHPGQSVRPFQLALGLDLLLSLQRLLEQGRIVSDLLPVHALSSLEPDVLLLDLLTLRLVEPVQPSLFGLGGSHRSERILWSFGSTWIDQVGERRVDLLAVFERYSAKGECVPSVGRGWARPRCFLGRSGRR